MNSKHLYGEAMDAKEPTIDEKEYHIHTIVTESTWSCEIDLPKRKIPIKVTGPATDIDEARENAKSFAYWAFTHFILGEPKNVR